MVHVMHSTSYLLFNVEIIEIGINYWNHVSWFFFLGVVEFIFDTRNINPDCTKLGGCLFNIRCHLTGAYKTTNQRGFFLGNSVGVSLSYTMKYFSFHFIVVILIYQSLTYFFGSRTFSYRKYKISRAPYIFFILPYGQVTLQGGHPTFINTYLTLFSFCTLKCIHIPHIKTRRLFATLKLF